MNIKPILFSTEMVQAILDGRKTETRRLIKPQPEPDVFGELYLRTLKLNSKNAPYRPGDILYVRETWCRYSGLYWHKAGLEVDKNGYCMDGFWADDISKPSGKKWVATKAPDKWKPSIHMPKEAARIFLRVTDVRVERLQDMTTADAEAEGAETDEWLDLCEEAGIVGLPTCTLREYFGHHIWDSTIKPADRERYSWEANPWVWVIRFDRCEKPEGWSEPK